MPFTIASRSVRIDVEIVSMATLNDTRLTLSGKLDPLRGAWGVDCRGADGGRRTMPTGGMGSLIGGWPSGMREQATMGAWTVHSLYQAPPGGMGSLIGGWPSGTREQATMGAWTVHSLYQAPPGVGGVSEVGNDGAPFSCQTAAQSAA